jgi:primosomal protein N' (replication factor Y) (superfamily II helicase)
VTYVRFVVKNGRSKIFHKMNPLQNSIAEQAFAEVVVFNALESTLHYVIPEELGARAEVGKRVLIPLGRREAVGMIVHLQRQPPDLARDVSMRQLMAIIDEYPIVPEDLIRLSRWVARYYFHPLGKVLQLSCPPGIHPEPVVSYRITEEGKTALDTDSPSALLMALHNSTELTLPQIKARLGTLSSGQRELNILKKRGWVERRFVWNTPSVRSKSTKMLRLLKPVNDLPAQVRNENLLQIIAALETSGGEMPLKKLRSRIKNLDYWVKRLHRQGMVGMHSVEELRESRCAQDFPCLEAPEPSPDQQRILESILPHLESNSFRPFALYGVTGSGKTEIYLRLIEKALKLRKGILVVVPEIALSTQLEALFRQRFDAALAIWHSGLPSGVRYDQWRQVLRGARKVVLGVRSAVFMPIKNLGLIIVDEEHDLSYKQEDRLRYHARDVALVRAQMLRIPIILGSATPSLQSFRQSHLGRYELLALPQRILDRPFPSIQIVDMRKEKGEFKILSRQLQEAIQETLKNRQQVILFLNRRGFATFLLCRLCGQAVQCPQCSVSLTYHREKERLCCHYCGLEQALPVQCPGCDRSGLIFHGFGTERLEQELKHIVPEARIVRMDRDTVSHPQDMAKLLGRVRSQEADVLIGTQMVGKGHDFPHVTLVGIINADVSLQISDFRAGENTVQLLMQVAGRAGRGVEPGNVIIQTYNPQHYTIRSFLDMDYLAFCNQELASREALQYPPYTKFLKLLVTAGDETTTRKSAQALAELCRQVVSQFRAQHQPVVILGPAPAPLWKLKNRYRWHIFVKTWCNKDLQEFIEVVLAKAKKLADLWRVELTVDRDPMSTL